jgi:hypothetical protein
MAYDEGLAQILRDALADRSGITEKRMFGGLCFMWNGNMLCGVHRGGGMARVGKANHAAALEIDGVTPMSFTGQPMGGMVDLTEDLIADDARRAAVLALADAFVGAMPPK